MRRPRAARGASEPAAVLPGMVGGGGYRGASGVLRELREWMPLPSSSDADTIPDLPTLRSRSRDLVRNSPAGGAAIGTVLTSVVGAGLEAQSTIDRDTLGLSADEAKEWENRAEAIWRHWCCRCDVRRREQFGQLQDTVLRSQLSSGDVFVMRAHRPLEGEDMLGLRLRVVEADRVATPPHKAGDPRIIDGLEQNSDGATVGVWIRNRHDADVRFGPERWKRVPMRGRATHRPQILHLADIERPGQSRGVPFLAPVIEPLKQIERITEAELAASVVASFFTVAIKTEQAMGLANGMDTTPTDNGTVNSSARDLKLAPAAVFGLRPNEDIVPIDPKRPNATFDPFVQAVLMQVGMRLEIPVEVLTKMFKASYSAARGALGEAWRFFLKRRIWLGRDLCSPVYEWVIAESVFRGLLAAPGFESDPVLRQAWLGVDWTGPAKGHVDPVKEVKAAREMRDAGWISDGEATQELRGTAYEVVAARQSRDDMVRRDSGLDESTVDDDTESDLEDEANPDLPEREDEA